MKLTVVLFLAAAGVATVSTQANAGDCRKISALAGQAMAARQGGQSFDDSLDKIGGSSRDSQVLMLKAYEKPVLTEKSEKPLAVREFQREAYKACLEGHDVQ